MKLSNLLGEIAEHLEDALDLMDRAIEEAEHFDNELIDKNETLDTLKALIMKQQHDIQELEKKNGK